jgi:hypothetical protein
VGCVEGEGAGVGLFEGEGDARAPGSLGVGSVTEKGVGRGSEEGGAVGGYAEVVGGSFAGVIVVDVAW